MVKDLVEHKSANISQSPAIVTYAKKHKEEKLFMADNRRRMLWLSVYILLSFICKLAVKKIIEMICLNIKIDKYLMIFQGLHFISKLAFRVLLADSVFYFLKVLSGFIRTFFPSQMFIISLIKNLSYHISILISLSIENKFMFELDHVEQETQEGFHSYVNDIEIPLFSLAKNIARDFLVRDAIITVLNYMVHYRYYEDRINKNMADLDILMKLNDYAGLGYTVDIDQSVAKIFELISSDGETISISDLNRALGETSGKKLFDLCKSEDQDHITKEELSVLYISTLTEQALIEKSINYNNFTVDCLKTVLNVLLFVVVAIEILNTTSSTKFEYIKIFNDPYTLLLTIFSVNYASSDSLKNFLTCLYFIFFIRPYEIGDMISFSGKNYIVSEINLLTTYLFDGNSYTIVPNSKMIGESITNMRLNKSWKEEFAFKFNYANFEERSHEVVQKLSEMTKKKPTEYRKAPYFKDVKLTENNKVETTLVVRFNTEATSIEKIRERRNVFVSNLSKILNISQLVPV